MIEQAGVYRMVLYENKGVSVVFNQDNSVQSLSNTGDVISIENSDCDTIELDLKFKQERSGNNKSKYKHTITWKQLGLDTDNINVINTLKKSIYGWIPEIEFYNKEKKVILNPVRFVNSSIDNNVSNHFEIALDNVNFGDSMNGFIEQFNYVFEDDENYIFEDSENFIFE